MSALPDLRPDPRPPVRKRVTVPLPPRDAFDLFTRGIARWWPDSHTRQRRARRPSRPDLTPYEPREGGRIVETTPPEGRRVTWATITRWGGGPAAGGGLAPRWRGRDRPS
ncbi:hypothetical protein [Wenxinia marina]|uniref:Uncharacterized protein n=1 Tax=Wenxinia marina DSM 24838 TaxID=1123501 RepID=A0A0D0QCW9_9RHOB|nr:hypothetical protein [Wenxinia marina]KIQ68833.1 hypothetical protein Wenmar_02561 [Wenxinia marina DSM 24838]